MTIQRSEAELRAIDQSSYFHPFTDLHEYSERGGRIFTRGEHIYIYDIAGNQVLDGMSGLWCCNLGYSQKSIKQAITRQLDQLPFYNSFFQCTNDAAIQMVAALVDVLPADFNHVFLTNSGSEANDTNIRLVHRYFDLLGKPNKKAIIGRVNGYHGSTIGAGSLGGLAGMHRQFTLLPNIHHVQQPYWFNEGGELSPEEFGLQAARSLEAKIDELGGQNVAAFIAEPIQGSGGVIVPPDSYWPEIQRICDERDILIISDEVICGFGRTGSWFGCQTYNYKPDLITFAKGVTNGYQPLGGVGISDKIADTLTAGGGEFNHGFTYSGHPVACAAGIATLALLKQGSVVKQVAEHIGPYFETRWRQLADHPVVGEARVKGLIASIELVRNKSSRERLAEGGQATLFCRNTAIERGLMIRAVGDTIICAPPLICTPQELDILFERLHLALDATAAKYGVA